MSGLTIRRSKEPDNTGGYDWCIADPDECVIAETFEHVGYSRHGVGTYEVRPAEANARLFAGAQDVLDAAKYLLTCLVQPTYDDCPCDECKASKALREAIARSEKTT